MAEIGAA